MTRPDITDADLNLAICRLQKEVARRLNEKGTGAFSSRHEILGVVVEEHREMENAVRSESLDKVADELYDEAVACVIGAACIMAGKVEW